MPGRRLTKEEQAEWRVRLEQPMRPAEMISLVKKLQDIIGLHFHIQPGLAFIRDAWTASRFAHARRADVVRLWPGERPDFEMSAQGQKALFEVTEADQPGRQRSREYRETLLEAETGNDPLVEEDPVENWVARAENAPQMLESAVRRKANIGYDPSINLVIYLNLGEYGIRRAQIEATMQPSTAEAKDAFAEIWVLWDGAAYLLWRHGQQVPQDRPLRGPSLED